MIRHIIQVGVSPPIVQAVYTTPAYPIRALLLPGGQSVVWGHRTLHLLDHQTTGKRSEPRIWVVTKTHSQQTRTSREEACRQSQ